MRRLRGTVARQAVELVPPDAAIVAAKFHVMALAGRALREVRGETRRLDSLALLSQRFCLSMVWEGPEHHNGCHKERHALY